MAERNKAQESRRRLIKAIAGSGSILSSVIIVPT